MHTIIYATSLCVVGLLAGPASQLAITQVPATAPAGEGFSIQVAIRDATGAVVTTDASKVTIGIATGPGNFSPGTLTATAVNGVATFNNLVLTKAGQYTFSVTDGTLKQATSGQFTVNPNIASKLAYVQKTLPATLTLGEFTNPSVTISVQDQFGNILDKDNSTVAQFSYMFYPTGAYLATGSKTLSTATAVNGIITYTYAMVETLTQTGNGAYIASCPNNTPTQVSSAFIVKNPSTTGRLFFTAGPSTGYMGKALAPVAVTLYDPSHNVRAADTSKVTLTVATGPGVFTTGQSVSVDAVKGVATFNSLQLTAPGVYTLQASDGLYDPNVSGPITIATASQVGFTQVPAQASAMTTLPTIKVSVLDVNGKLVTGDSSTVTLSKASGPAGADFHSGSKLTAQAKGGIATFYNLELDTPGVYTFKATDGTLAGATSASVTINPGPSRLFFAVPPPTTAQAGVPINATVKVAVQDGNGKIVATDQSTVSLHLGNAMYPAVASGGIATFSFKNLILTTAGSQVAMATDGTLTPATSPLAISPGAASKLAFTAIPPTPSPTSGIGPVLVSIVDQYGNPMTANSSSVVSLGVASGPGPLSPSATMTAKAVNGVATFNNLVLGTPGIYTFNASAGSLASGPSNAVAIYGAPSKVVLTQVPQAGGTAGQAFAVQATIQDASGTTVPTDNTSIVTIGVASGPTAGSATSPAGFTSGSTLTARAVNGVAQFGNFVLNTAGTYTFTVASGSLAGGVSASFTINPAASAGIAILKGFPNTVKAGSSVGITAVDVAVVDAFGNTVTSDNSTSIQLVMFEVSGGFTTTVGPEQYVTASHGVASFPVFSTYPPLLGAWMLFPSATIGGQNVGTESSFTVE